MEPFPGAEIHSGVGHQRGDGAALDAALAALDSPPIGSTGPISDHASDALLTAAWLRHIAGNAALWGPAPLTDELACTEGWTFGII